jgi:hypothetical protein
VTDSAPSEIEKGPAELVPPATQAFAPWYPPPSYPPPRIKASGSTDGRAVASLIAAIAGIVLGTLAYFLGRSAVSRIDSSKGGLGGRSIAVSGWVLGVVAMAMGSVITLVWIVVVLVATAQPAAGG